MKRLLAFAVKSWLGGSLAAILALSGLVGCQPTFLSRDVWDQAHSSSAMLPAAVEQNHCPVTGPITPGTKAPPTVNYPERRQREMTLQEAIAIALETGLVSANAPEGQAVNSLAVYNGTLSTNAQTDSIRVLSFNPALAQAAIEASLARFDPIWVTSATMNAVDGIPGVQNIGNIAAPFTPGQGGTFHSSIVKAFSNGMVANASFLMDYRRLAPNTAPGLLNPEAAAKIAFGLELPLWRDSGVEINQLVSRFPTPTGLALTSPSALNGFNIHQAAIAQLAGVPVEGTLISRLRFDQSRAEFERNVQTMIKNVEISYWNLYNKYGQLYSFEENLRILQRAYQENDIKLKAGNLDPYKFYQTKGQFEEFRANRIQALEEVLAAERHLRGILGLPVEDGERIVPITEPSLASIRPNWDSCLQDALSLRPELVIARDNLRYHQYLLTIQKNNLKPDVRAFLKYEPFGQGSTLLGGGGTFTDLTGVSHSTDTFRSLADGGLADYTAGVYMNVPLGFRFELAAIRSARLQLAQSYHFLRDQEDKAVRFLALQYADTQHWHKRIEAHRSERLAYVDALKKLEAKIKAGAKDMTYGNLEFLSVQRSYAAALVKEYAAIAEYNNALARLEFAKGTTLAYNNVHISEGALPQCATVRAVEYEKQRSKSLVLNNIRPDSLAQPGRLCAKKESEVLSATHLPAVTVTESPESSSLPVLPVPPVAEGRPRLLTAPIMPGSPLNENWNPNLPVHEKVEFKPSSAPAPAKLPAMPSNIKPVEPAVPLFLQQTSSLQGAGAQGFITLDARAPATARGTNGEPR